MSLPVPMALSTYETSLAEHRAVFTALDGLSAPVAAAIGLLARCLRGGGTILLCGNGGSAGDSQHIAAELVGRFDRERRPLSAIALSTDTSILTAVANDYGYDHVFARQVAALGRPGDCLVALSTSGNSPNVLEAVRVARERGMSSLAISGRDGGCLRGLCDVELIVPSSITARIQEAHIFLGHVLCQGIEAELGLVERAADHVA